MYGGEPEDITICFTDKLIGVVYDKFGENTKITRIDKGNCVATVRVQISPTLWGWLFQFVGQMKIISPDTVIEKFKEYAENLNCFFNR